MSWKDPIPHHQVERDPSKADLVSPGLLGIPTTPTPVIGIRSEQIANASFVIDTVASAGHCSQLLIKIGPELKKRSIQVPAFEQG